ncbi:MAG: flippase [candidate division Zixibacteria bacterium]|nr:flippase [candidate division Zixibacteria bacterium]
MSIKKTILKNFFSLSFSEVISCGLKFVSVIYLARILGAEGFGKINFATATLAYFMLLVNLGLNTYGIREIARDKERMKKYINNILTIKLLSSVFAFLLVAIFVYFLPKPLEIKKLILFFGFSLFTFSFTIDWVFMGIQRMQYIALARITQNLIYVTLIVTLVKIPDQILSIPLVQVGSALVAVLILMTVFVRKYGSFKLDFDFSFWKEILSQSFPMALSLIAIQIYLNFDTVMLGFMKSDGDVGWYNAAYKVIGVLLLGGCIYYNAIFPVISNLYKKSLEKLKHLMQFTLSLMILIIAPMLVLGTIFAAQIIGLIFGDGYQESVVVFQILLWSVAAVLLNGLFGGCLLGCDRQKYHLVCVSVGALMNLILNFLLIPPFGIKGAAIATVAAETTVLFMFYFGTRKIVMLSPREFFSLSLFQQGAKEVWNLIKHR